MAIWSFCEETREMNISVDKAFLGICYYCYMYVCNRGCTPAFIGNCRVLE